MHVCVSLLCFSSSWMPWPKGPARRQRLALHLVDIVTATLAKPHLKIESWVLKFVVGPSKDIFCIMPTIWWQLAQTSWWSARDKPWPILANCSKITSYRTAKRVHWYCPNMEHLLLTIAHLRIRYKYIFLLIGASVYWRYIVAHRLAACSLISACWCNLVLWMRCN